MGNHTLTRLPEQNLWTTWVIMNLIYEEPLTHRSRVINEPVNYAITGSDNALSPLRRQAIIWTNTGLWLIGTVEKTFTGHWIEMQQFVYNKMHLEVVAILSHPKSVDIIQNKIKQNRNQLVVFLCTIHRSTTRLGDFNWRVHIMIAMKHQASNHRENNILSWCSRKQKRHVGFMVVTFWETEFLPT